MALKAAVCQGCGGNLDVDESREYGFCPFCGLKYYTEKIIHNTYITNDYSGATITVQAADIDNYIKLIHDSLGSGKYDEADKYYNEAIVYGPDNEALLYTKIEMLFTKLQDEAYDMCEVKPRNSEDDNKQDFFRGVYENKYQTQNSATPTKKYGRIKGINYKQVFDDYYDTLSKIKTPEYLDKSFSIAIETLINIFTPIEKLSTMFLMYKNIPGVTKDERWQYRRTMQANQIPIYGYLLDLFADERISESVIEKGLELIIAQYNDNPPSYKSKTTSALIAASEGTRQYFMFSNNSKPEIIVKKKSGKTGDALYFGNYILYFVRKSHPNYDSQTLHDFEALSSEENERECYVATCVYGSNNCYEVQALRGYRDNYLKKKWYGRLFVKVYYFVSPRIVRIMGDSSYFKRFWKSYLDRKIIVLRQKGYDSK